MKSKILATTLVGLLFGLAACDKPQENSLPKDSKQKVEAVEPKTESVEQKQTEVSPQNTTEIDITDKTEGSEPKAQDNIAKTDMTEENQSIIAAGLKENKVEPVVEKVAENKTTKVDIVKSESLENQSKKTQDKVKKVAERSEAEKVLAILEKQYQNVRCAEGQESGYCLEESQRLKNEIKRLKAQLGK
ncbi:hypothetical protein [Canicola haemoglobinophilus]|uniref:hypothetical protein n=1 Tax=Canicola haemoglobinophilus TaxID=733 RepID=UPI000E08C611|nr:hypothetical protein [Canicola haemoglobinophilus]STO54305.1 Uncharacterised protein [Canicola haemoglobinophilus]